MGFKDFGGLCEEHANRLKLSCERIQYQAQDLKGNHSKHRLVTWLPQDYRRVRFSLWQNDEALRGCALDRRSVSQRKRH